MDGEDVCGKETEGEIGLRVPVARLAALVRVPVSEQESAVLEKEVSELLSFASAMPRVEASGLNMAAWRTEGPEGALREDAVQVPDFRAALLAGAPAQMEGMILVPRAVD